MSTNKSRDNLILELSKIKNPAYEVISHDTKDQLGNISKIKRIRDGRIIYDLCSEMVAYQLCLKFNLGSQDPRYITYIDPDTKEEFVGVNPLLEDEVSTLS